MRTTVIAGMFVFAVALPQGHGGEAKADYASIVQDMLRLIGEMTTQLKTVTEKDANSAVTAQPMILKSAKEFVVARDKAKAAKPPSVAEKAKLEKMFRDKMIQAQKQFFAEMARVRTFDAGKALVAEIAKALAEKKKKTNEKK